MTENDMRVLIRAAAAQAGSWAALGKQWGFSAAYLHQVATDQPGKHVTDSLARLMGYRRVERVEFEAVREE